MKHTSTLTILLPLEHSIQTRDTTQDIRNGMMTITNKFWVGGR